MTRTPKKNANGLEDLEDFFLSDDEYSSPATQRYSIKPMKAETKVLKVPSGNQQKTREKEIKERNVPTSFVSSGEEDEGEEESQDSRADEMIKSAAVFGSPIKPKLRISKRAADRIEPRGNGGIVREHTNTDIEDIDAESNNLIPSPVIRPPSVHSSPKKQKPRISRPDTRLQRQRIDVTDTNQLESKMKKSSRLTKSIALHKTGRNKTFNAYAEDDGEEEEKASKIKENTREVNRVPDEGETGKKVNGLPVEKSLRHSTRKRVKPLAWWRNEHVVYQMKKEHGAYVMEVKDVVHRPDLSQTPKRRLATGGKRRTSIQNNGETPSRKRGRPPKAKEVVETPNVEPETVSEPVTDVQSLRTSRSPKKTDIPAEEPQINLAGSQWLADKALTIPVFEGPGSETQIERTVAWAPNQGKNITIIRNNDEYFKVRTLFDQDAEFSGAGIIELPVNSRKAVKSNEDTYFIFYVIDGLLEVSLSHNVFVVSKGCSFEIPMGNFYQFESKGKTPVKLFFVQSKYVVISNPDGSDMDSDTE
ncbi:DEKNAAC103376 [Brettanomyces naardenensis]|uniref:DEKNAAC103376 n=1 Tax=Brettanomyces naardenensis TaxID=13370 RepID=A0A448YNN6_BRENA|nr:DEKNAAC103376 [Brettanomyces naardenensis]